MKRRYRRYFIILENEDSGFEASSNQSPKGHAKVEISNGKGSMVLNCQNLKNLEDKRMRYRWYLVNTNKEEPTVVDIGPMEVDENGKGEMTWEFNGENVKASKETIEDFNLLALMVESFDDKKVLVAPLVGYIEKEKFSWRDIVETKLYGTRKQEGSIASLKPTNNYSPQRDNQSTINNLTLKPDKKEEKEESIAPNEKEEIKPVADAESVTEIKSQPETKTNMEVKPDIKNSIPSHKLEGNNNYGEIKIKASQTDYTTPSKASVSPNEADKGYNDNTFAEGNILKALQSYIESTVKMFPKVKPFEESLENYSWWHIYYNYQTIYRAHMPFIAYIDGMKYPTHFYPYQYPSDYQRQIYKYQHYIFGIAYDDKKEVRYYVYGIPGKKIKAEQPYGGTTGFDYWHPSLKGSVKEGTPGYWLLHIDPQTGRVIKPLKATKPLDLK